MNLWDGKKERDRSKKEEVGREPSIKPSCTYLQVRWKFYRTV